jgi:DNA polymerase (family 10)
VGRRAISDALSELAFCVELLGDGALGGDRLDAKSVNALAWSIRSLQVPEGSDLRAALVRLPDLTPRVAAVVDDVLAERAPPFLTELKTQLPPGLLLMRRLKGLGPKKIHKLWKDLGIESLGELEYACKENRLVTLDGFGDKTQAAILAQLHEVQTEAGLFRRDQVEFVVSAIVETLQAAGHRALLAGDHRRGCELVRDIVVVTTGPAPADAPPFVRFVGSVPVEVWGAHVVIGTGSAEHVAALEARAQARLGRGLAAVVADDEAGVYAALGAVYVDAEAREGGVVADVGKARPRLVTRADLRGALHNHTTASDGSGTVAEMMQAARAVGLVWLGITDHSVTAAYAHGLDAPRLRAQHDEIHAATAAAGGQFVMFSGIETDILKDGALDYADDVLFGLDVVVASMHQRYGQKGAPLTERLVRAALHPAVDVVGHPTGRLLLSRAAADFDVAALLDACAASGTAVELNASPARLDLSEAHLRLAKERGVLVSIAADAHAPEELAYLEHGVALARRAGLTADDVLNSRSAAEVRAFVQQRRAKALAQQPQAQPAPPQAGGAP